MTSVQQSQEDLEARIARIKKRNEEIEKKHREAEADRLMAMKENAMVEIKPPKDEDWPREHKYDKIDFTYDLDADALAELEEKKKEKNAFIQKIAKDYKVFAEGEGPPPDPAYSFLADVERDGEKAQSALAAASSAMTFGMPGSVPNRGGKNQFDRKTPMNRSGRLSNNGVGLNGSGGSGRGRGKPGGGGYSGGGGLQRSLSTNEHDGGRRGPAPPPNGDYIRHNRGGGGGQGEGGKWRRDWEHDRSKDDGCINSQSSNGLLRGGDPQQQQQQQQQGLTVSVSQDGEFKSVKVTAPPVWGSGRVGPRQPAKPQFQFQTGPGGYNQQQQQQHPHHQQPPHHHRGGAGPNNENHFNRNASGRKSDKDVNGGKQQRGGPQQQQGPAGSVQDRLNRNRVGTSNGGGSSSEQIKSNPSLKTISKIIEKNAEIDERLARQMFQENEKMASRMKELRMQDGA